MTKKPSFDPAEAHKYFSAGCFNAAWEFIDKPERTALENSQMLATCFASLWHWSQRPDVTDKHYSISYWQISRVFALTGNADMARTYGQMSLQKGEGLEPFYLGYAYEALARAEAVAGDTAARDKHLAAAKEQAAKVIDAESKKMLDDDLAAIANL